MNKLSKVIEQVSLFILGDQRSGGDRRVKVSKRKRTRRKTQRRK